MVKVSEIKGKTVVSKRGIKMGKVEEVELNANTWAIESVWVKLEDEVAKIFDAKGGFMTKTAVPIPGNLMGPIGENITLTEEIKDPQTLLEHMKTRHAIM